MSYVAGGCLTRNGLSVQVGKPSVSPPCLLQQVMRGQASLTGSHAATRLQVGSRGGQAAFWEVALRGWQRFRIE